MFLSFATEPLKRKDVQNLLFKMENITEAIVETLEEVNEVSVETGKDLKDLALEKTEISLANIVDATKEVGEILEQAESKLKDMKKEKMEEMVEENSAAKPYRGVKR